ncbi:MAG: dihydrodipicolinate synthase family protein, partial [Gemmatimonadetes bacterium]|nr:dihydrodipicolinate synthase family protein [Gemmatimonadota bacterium]
MRAIFEFNVEAGVHVFWVAGRTGESILLSDGENRRIAEIVSDQKRGRVKNIMH